MSITSGKTLFTADWDDAAFVHYEMEPRDLQPHVPFDLDLYHGRAYLSLVAFVQRGLRPRVGGRLAGLLAAPLASHPFLNVRTYVQHRGERGIYFLREWIPNRLAALIGPPLYGLPYKIGRLTYACDRERGASEHRICAGSGLEFDVAWDADAELRHVEPGSRDEFLLERYTAFTCCRGRPMCFRVDHGPWPQTCARVRMKQIALLTEIGLCLPAGGPVAANVSPGVKRVGLSAPIRVRTEDCKEGRRRPSELVSWLPLIVLVTGVLAFGVRLRPWVWMWCIAGAIFAGCKWLTWWREPMRLQARAGQSAAYLFAWVGMNPREFLAKNPAVAIP
ncbi:MAG TPA: DUF2071 domain-containing protein, partial [Tepidisphaeraceae bacterium]|nr:DUF2071 domain-containing protein [Tepidisphaeraceae bacterium]